MLCFTIKNIFGEKTKTFKKLKNFTYGFVVAYRHCG